MTSNGKDIQIGCAGLPPRMGRKKYDETLEFLEIQQCFNRIPKTSIIEKWKKGKNSLLAWRGITHPPDQADGYEEIRLDKEEVQQAGNFQATEFVHLAVENMAAVAEICAATAIVFRCPSSFSPSAQNKEILRLFFQEVASPARFSNVQRVFEPAGLWEMEDAVKFTASLGISCLVDPLTNDPLGPPASFYSNLEDERPYFHIKGHGSNRRRLDEFKTETLLGILDHYDGATVVFDTIKMFSDAKAFLKATRQGF